MRSLLAAVTIAFGSLAFAPVQVSAIAPAPMTSAIEQLGGVDTAHCTPGKRHHIPTWNYQSDGCRRPSKKKKAPAKGKTPPAKSSSQQ